MKKTISAAVGMIVVFSFVVFYFSMMMERQWQTPQQDNVNLTVNPPVEMVEKEYKEYKYNTDVDSNWFANKAEILEGMLTYSEAASISGRYIEEIFWYIDTEDIVFDIAVLSNDRFLIQYIYTEKNTDKKFDLAINCYIDAYTGEVLSIRNTLKSTNYIDEMILQLRDAVLENPQEYLKEKANQALNTMGYGNITYFDIEEHMYGYNITVEAEKDKRKDAIYFELNNYYVNDEWINWDAIEYMCNVYPKI